MPTADLCSEEKVAAQRPICRHAHHGSRIGDCRWCGCRPGRHTDPLREAR